jgi:hypothetical protein
VASSALLARRGSGLGGNSNQAGVSTALSQQSLITSTSSKHTKVMPTNRLLKDRGNADRATIGNRGGKKHMSKKLDHTSTGGGSSSGLTISSPVGQSALKHIGVSPRAKFLKDSSPHAGGGSASPDFHDLDSDNDEESLDQWAQQLSSSDSLGTKKVYSGDEGRAGFFVLYKELVKAKRLKGQPSSRPPSIRNGFLEKCVEMNVAPNPSAIISKDYADTLNLSNAGIGDKLALALAVSLKLDSKDLRHIQLIDLSNNRIGPDGAVAILSSLKHCSNIWGVNLSQNILGLKGIQELGSLITDRYTCHIVDLNLSHCKLGNTLTKILANCLDEK